MKGHRERRKRSKHKHSLDRGCDVGPDAGRDCSSYRKPLVRQCAVYARVTPGTLETVRAPCSNRTPNCSTFQDGPWKVSIVPVYAPLLQHFCSQVFSVTAFSACSIFVKTFVSVSFLCGTRHFAASDISTHACFERRRLNVEFRCQLHSERSVPSRTGSAPALLPKICARDKRKKTPYVTCATSYNDRSYHLTDVPFCQKLYGILKAKNCDLKVERWDLSFLFATESSESSAAKLVGSWFVPCKALHFHCGSCRETSGARGIVIIVIHSILIFCTVSFFFAFFWDEVVKHCIS